MATTTTNFGWDIPQSTDLVKDGATAIAALGQDIDTAFIDLKGGTTGQVLSKASGTDLDFTWVAQDDSNAIQNAIVDAKGDLITATAADTPSRLAVGSNGQVLTADSTTATGIKWASVSASPLTTKGDIYTYSTNDARLPVGSNYAVLSSDSSASTGLIWTNSWTAYTPTRSSGGGSGAVSNIGGRYMRIGKTCIVSFYLEITAGTGSVYWAVSAPFTAATGKSQAGVGIEDNSTGKQLSVSIGSAGTNFVIKNYDGTFPGNIGTYMYCSISYEVA